MYLIAREITHFGCIAVQVENCKEAANLVAYLGPKVLNKGIEILTVTNPEIYGEYKPYTYMSNVKEFTDRILDMCKENNILFSDLKMGLEEAISYEKGNGKAKITSYTKN